MNNLLANLRTGNWKSLLACFLYFDTGFTVWVMYGPLAQSIGTDLSLSTSQKAFLTAVPVLAAALLRISFGTLFQTMDGKKLAMIGIALSAIPATALLAWPGMPSLPVLLVLGVLLGMGGASFAVALPMAGSSYPPRVQGLVLGLAAAGNIGAMVDGFLLPPLAERFGWQYAIAVGLPMLAIAAIAILAWADDRAPKSGSVPRAAGGFVVSLIGLIVLVLIVNAGLFGLGGSFGMLVLPLIGAVLMLLTMPRHYRALFAERDTWSIMLIYAVTFGGFVGMSSYVSPLLIDLYGISKIDGGLWMAALACTGALVRPFGGWIADRVSGVRALLVLLAAIAACDFAFALLQPALAGGLVLLFAMYVCFGLGNGATFQLVPQRWSGRTGLMSGIIGAAGGIGGFYLPTVLGIARQNLGNYWVGFAIFGGIAALAWVMLVVLQRDWLAWALPEVATESAGEEPLLAPMPESA